MLKHDRLGDENISRYEDSTLKDAGLNLRSSATRTFRSVSGIVVSKQVF